MKTHKALAAVLVSFLITVMFAVERGQADEGELESVLVKAKDNALTQKHLLRYKFTEGEVLQWKVAQLATTEAIVRGNRQTSKVSSKSTKQWEVIDVDEDQNATFVYSVVDVDMWQKVSDRPEVRYNSRKDETAPADYTQVAKTVGVPISTVKITPTGQVLSRDKTPVQINSGLGKITVPLPAEPVEIGQSWHLTNEVRARRPDGQQMRVKTRLAYALEAVKTGVATISVKTEVLTPINDPRIKVQLVQQLTDGELKFDMDAGRVISRQIDWDETIVGFNGNNSRMEYLARFTEDLVPAEKVAKGSDKSEVR